MDGTERTSLETPLSTSRVAAQALIGAGRCCAAKRRQHAVRALAAALAAAVLLAGCATAWSRKDQLEETLLAYEDALRWSEFDVANGFGGGKSQIDPGRLQRIKVTSYEVVNSTVDDDKRHAQQTVQIRYYDKDSAREQVLVDRQQWTYDPAKKRWLLQSGLPPFE